MAAPPDDVQISASPDAQALQEVVPAQVQAQAQVPVEVISCFLVSSFGFWRVLFRLPFVLVVFRGPYTCSRLITFMPTDSLCVLFALACFFYQSGLCFRVL